MCLLGSNFTTNTPLHYQVRRILSACFEKPWLTDGTMFYANTVPDEKSAEILMEFSDGAD